MEEPRSADLLAIARRTLLDDVVPALDGDRRFRALMVANALAIAARAEAQAAAIADAEAALGSPAGLRAAIRAGRLDPGAPGRDQVAAALLTLAEARCRVSAPKALAPDG